MSDVAYRYEPRRYSLGVDEYDISYGYRVEIELVTFRVLRHTPKGFWIDIPYGQERFVRSEGRKRYAALTLAEASASFRARKARQMVILKGQLEYAQRQLAAFERLDPFVIPPYVDISTI